MTREEGAGPTHSRCGFPVFLDREGNWRHVSRRDEEMCELFGDGGMLAPLMEEE